MSVVLPLPVPRSGEAETETGLRDDAGQPGAVWPPPPLHGEEGQLHAED